MTLFVSYLRCILCCTFELSPVIYFPPTRLHVAPERELVFVTLGAFCCFHLPVHGSGIWRGFREWVAPVREKAHNGGNETNHPSDDHVLYVMPIVFDSRNGYPCREEQG